MKKKTLWMKLTMLNLQTRMISNLKMVQIKQKNLRSQSFKQQKWCQTLKKGKEISPDIKSPKSLQQPKVVNPIGDSVNVPIKTVEKKGKSKVDKINTKPKESHQLF